MTLVCVCNVSFLTSAMTIQPAIILEDEFHLNGLNPLLGQWNCYLLRSQILIILSTSLVEKKNLKSIPVSFH